MRRFIACFDYKHHWLMLGIGIKVRKAVFILLVGHRELFILEYELIPASPSSSIMRKSPKRNNFSFSKLQSWFPIPFLLPTSCFLPAVSTFASCIIPSLSSKPVFMLSKDLPPPLTLGLLFCQSSLQYSFLSQLLLIFPIQTTRRAPSVGRWMKAKPSWPYIRWKTRYE